MKRITTIICCVAMMIMGVSVAFMNFSPISNNMLQAATVETAPLTWTNNGTGNVLPLDLRLDSEKRLSRTCLPKDSVILRDSVRYITKVKWKTRYKDVADRTTAREAGVHLTAATPDSLPENLAITSTMGREEQPIEVVDVSKTPSIQLSVDGQIVYSSNDNHSAERGQP